jgi:hypothetical protein
MRILRCDGCGEEYFIGTIPRLWISASKVARQVLAEELGSDTKHPDRIELP